MTECAPQFSCQYDDIAYIDTGHPRCSEVTIIPVDNRNVPSSIICVIAATKRRVREKLSSMKKVDERQVAARWSISRHRPPAISRKIGSALRAGGGGGAERRSRNSVRARSCALGSAAPVAVWQRARIRVVSPARPPTALHK